jgi:putative ABC transport system ATP-binding protein
VNEAAPRPDPPLLVLRNVTKRYGSAGRTLTVLEGVDLVVQAGEAVAVLGPSGSGKSTLLGLVAGLDRPSRGEILLEGEPVHELPDRALARIRRRKIGFVFQSFHLLGALTARENVLLPLELAGVEETGSRADELLAAVDLTGRAAHYPSQLSGGERQRVAIARAFAARPRLLLADEPTGNLDRRTGRRVLALLAELRRSSGVTLLIVTHDQEAAALADRRLFLEDGRVVRVEEGSGAGDAS